jgi:hypothetical protein
VALVSESFLPTSTGERLTGATSRVDRSISPSCKVESESPSADTREPMSLFIIRNLRSLYLLNRPIVHVTIGQVPTKDQILEPFNRVGFDLVIIDPH